ncbi:MAG: hypothetical protein R2758_08940 [Bacteroidales bacterium]
MKNTYFILAALFFTAAGFLPMEAQQSAYDYDDLWFYRVWFSEKTESTDDYSPKNSSLRKQSQGEKNMAFLPFPKVTFQSAKTISTCPFRAGPGAKMHIPLAEYSIVHHNRTKGYRSP